MVERKEIHQAGLKAQRNATLQIQDLMDVFELSRMRTCLYPKGAFLDRWKQIPEIEV